MPEGSGADLKQPLNVHIQGHGDEGVRRFYKTVFHAPDA